MDLGLVRRVMTDQAGLRTYDGSADEELNLGHIAHTGKRTKMVLAFGNIAAHDRQRRKSLDLALSALSGCELLSIGAPTALGYPIHPRKPGYATPLKSFSVDSLRSR